jgi:imidazolonepropionase
MLIHSASQLLTLTGGPQRGSYLGHLKIIPNGAVLIQEGKIVDIGLSSELLLKYPEEKLLDANQKTVLPGFVDPHTHLVWAGDRAEEFEMRLQGESYLDIMAAGGGIQSTVNSTRTADFETLLYQAEKRAVKMFFHGTTTAEAKSGYGLDIKTELKQMEVAFTLNEKGPLEIFPSYLGAHAIPPEYQFKPDEYVKFICEIMLPDVKDFSKRTSPNRTLPFVDVFCEKGAFSLLQSRIILERAKTLGFQLKIHADEFENLGGVSLAVELDAISADHLVKTSRADISALGESTTVAVSLPCTPFGLGENEYSPAKNMIAADCLFALASDLNPGTAWCGNMQFVMALACRYMGLTPAQAIAASTINAAAAIGQQNKIGSIEIGKQADMIILSVSDYRQLPYQFGINLVDTIIKKGKVYKENILC